MKQLFTEILTEVPKLSDPKYCGVIIVHPDDVGTVFDFILDKVAGFNYVKADIKSLKFKSTKSYGSLSIRTAENDKWYYDHAAHQYTTIILDMNSFGKHIINSDVGYVEFEPVGSSSPEESIPYMMTRMRTESIYKPRFVIC